MNAPLRQRRLKLATNGLHKAGTGYARRAGEMTVEQRGRGHTPPHDGVEKGHRRHSRWKGRAGASCSRVMDTLCAPAAQGAT